MEEEDEEAPSPIHCFSPPSSLMDQLIFYCMLIDWIGLEWTETDRIGFDWIGWTRTGIDGIGLVWNGLDWFGLDWVGSDWVALYCPALYFVEWYWIGLVWVEPGRIDMSRSGLQRRVWIDLALHGLGWIRIDGFV